MRDTAATHLPTAPAFFRGRPACPWWCARSGRRMPIGCRPMCVASRARAGATRFLGLLSELAPTELVRISRMDRPDALALLAVVADGREDMIVGEAIQAAAPGSVRCEISLAVTDGWQRRGLGTRLVQNMECRARMLGARFLVGDVLRTNVAMKCLARKRGFSVMSPVTDARLVEIVTDLSVPHSGPPCREQFAPPSIA